MSLDTYTNLKLELAAWLHRSDQTTEIDTFIDLAEARFNRTLRVRQMVSAVASLSVSGNVITPPVDWAAWKQILLMSQPVVELRITSEAGALDIDSSNAAGIPRRVIVRGTGSALWPTPDGVYAYRGVYYAKIPALSSTVATNWLLADYPDAYLYGALLAATAFVQDDARVGQWKMGYDEVMQEITTASGNDEYGQDIGGVAVPRGM